MRTLGAFDFRNNAIGFLRLFFAAGVFLCHAKEIGGFGTDFLTTAGSRLSSAYLAVAGFFVLSGFLIARSFETSGNGALFLRHRVLRLFPAFWVCLAAVAFGFAPVAYLHEHGTLRGFLSISPSPLGYITRNALLQINQISIGTLLAHLPEPNFFNGSLWTLIWEFLCYLTVFAVGMLGMLKRRRWVVALAFLAFYLGSSALLIRTGHGSEGVGETIELMVIFWAGACAYLFRDRIPMRWPILAACVLVLAVTLPTKAYAAFLIPCFAYLTLFAADQLPVRSFDRRADLSYGLYIYAYPVQQTSTIFGVTSFGFGAYLALSAVISVALAATSWFTVEKPCLRLKNSTLSPSSRRNGSSHAGIHADRAGNVLG